jgi:hypothetical protein
VTGNIRLLISGKSKRADARGRDDRVREELAAGVAPMTNHGHIRACPYSLVASRITTGRAKRLPAIPILASAMQGGDFILLINAQLGGPLSGANRKTFADSEVFRF